MIQLKIWLQLHYFKLIIEITYLRRTPPKSEAFKHSGGCNRRWTSATVTLYFEVELNKESLPGTEQKISVGAADMIPSLPAFWSLARIPAMKFVASSSIWNDKGALWISSSFHQCKITLRLVIELLTLKSGFDNRYEREKVPYYCIWYGSCKSMNKKALCHLQFITSSLAWRQTDILKWVLILTLKKN